MAAMRRSAQSYQHIDPALVGNEMRVVVSELSGRGNLLSKAEEYGLEVDDGDRCRRGAQRDQGAGSAGLLLRSRRSLGA